MPDLTLLDIDDLVDAGVLAYRNRDYKAAVVSLQQALDAQNNHWRAKLYLAMSLYHGGESFTALRHFITLRDTCPDSEIRGKAEAAMNAINAQMASKPSTPDKSVVRESKPAGMPEMTCSLKKPVLPPPSPKDGSEIEWIKNERE